MDRSPVPQLERPCKAEMESAHIALHALRDITYSSGWQSIVHCAVPHDRETCKQNNQLLQTFLDNLIERIELLEDLCRIHECFIRTVADTGQMQCLVKGTYSYVCHAIESGCVNGRGTTKVTVTLAVAVARFVFWEAGEQALARISGRLRRFNSKSVIRDLDVFELDMNKFDVAVWFISHNLAVYEIFISNVGKRTLIPRYAEFAPQFRTVLRSLKESLVLNGVLLDGDERLRSLLHYYISALCLFATRTRSVQAPMLAALTQLYQTLTGTVILSNERCIDLVLEKPLIFPEFVSWYCNSAFVDETIDEATYRPMLKLIWASSKKLGDDLVRPQLRTQPNQDAWCCCQVQNK